MEEKKERRVYEPEPIYNFYCQTCDMIFSFTEKARYCYQCGNRVDPIDPRFNAIVTERWSEGDLMDDCEKNSLPIMSNIFSDDSSDSGETLGTEDSTRSGDDDDYIYDF